MLTCTTRPLAFVVALLATLACQNGDDSLLGSNQSKLIEDPAVAAEVLEFLNHQTTTSDILKNKVGLDRRAAQNLVQYRNGPDALFGTADDQLFRTISEVLNVYRVGPVSLELIRIYVTMTDWRFEEEEYFALFQDVSFTVSQMEVALIMANHSSEWKLRVEVGIPARTVIAIIEARPIHSIGELSELRLVGPMSLQRLRNYAAIMSPPPLCITDNDCSTGARCHRSNDYFEGACRFDNDVYGFYDDVAFNYQDAENSLVLVNLADSALLLDNVGLSGLAVESLEAQRPIQSIKDLSRVLYVGPVSLRTIRDFARQNPDLIQLMNNGRTDSRKCTSSEDCSEEEICAGIMMWGEDKRGECRKPENLPGEGVDCIPEDRACAEGLICSGLTREFGWGICYPKWMSARYEFEGFLVPPGETQTIAWEIEGLATVPFDTVFTFECEESYPSLVITLENYFETVVPVWPNPYFGEVPLPGEHIAFPLTDEVVNGPWKLHVENVGNRPIVVGSWSIYMSSHWD